MTLATTERSDDLYGSLDLWPTGDLVAAILSVQQQALRALEPARPALAAAIEALAGVMRAGGRMAYAGAGTSGLVAHMDALELPGTFGVGRDRVPVILAGGAEALRTMAGGAEDDAGAAEAAVDALGLGAGDGLVAVAASGSTPFTLAALRRAKARGAVTVGIACVAGAPLLGQSHHPILIETPSEVVAGSTRMGAGTAQKCALNILSTGVATRLGHAYAGLMVNMSADNSKLRRRAAGIVARAAGIDLDEAERALAEAGGSIKVAVTQCVAGVGPDEARARLARSGGDIRAALAPGDRSDGPNGKPARPSPQRRR